MATVNRGGALRIGVRGTAATGSLTRSAVRRIFSAVLREHGVCSADCSVVFVTDRAIKRLNHRFLGRNRPTDVIAFGLGGGPAGRRKAGLRKSPFGGKRGQRFTGDIAVSVDRARCQARRFKTSFKYEITLYLIHGLLHLLGYDDGSPREIREMRRKESELMERICGLRTSWTRSIAP